MPNSTVFLSKMTGTISDEAKQQFLKMVEEQILYFTDLKNSVSFSNTVDSQPHVIIAMYDFGGLSGLKASAMGMAIKLKTIAFFARHSMLLGLSDISMPLSGTFKV